MLQRQFLTTLVAAVVALSAAFTYGLYVGANKVSPYNEIRGAKRYVSQLILGKSSLWSAPVVTPLKNERITHFERFFPNSDYAMVGDSLTQNGIWREIFPNKLIANRGINGDSSREISHRIYSILNVKPKKVFTMFGINDIIQNFPTAFIIKNYRNTVSKLRNAGVEVIIQSTIECSLRKCGKMLQAVRALNVDLQRFARDEGLVFIDLNEDLTSPAEGLLPQYTSDGFHLLGSGYSVWAKKIETFLD